MAPWWLRESSDEIPSEDEADAGNGAPPFPGLIDDQPAPPPAAEPFPLFDVEAVPEREHPPPPAEPPPPPAEPPPEAASDRELPPEPAAASDEETEPRPRKRRRRKRRKPTPSSEAPAAEREADEAPVPRLARPPEGERTEGPAAVEALSRELSLALSDRTLAADEPKIAMFCDLENIALGVRDSDVEQFDIHLVLERLLEKGKIIVKKAYADWERYSEYKRPFHEAAVELIDIPQKHYSGKNSADIKLVVDAMDLCYSKEHLDTFVVVSGDSDFSPLVSKLKENNKYVIGLGVKNASASLLVDNCDEFIYYEDVWRDRAETPPLDYLSPKEGEVFGLMIDAMLALMRENKSTLWPSMIKQTMKRKHPSFSESYYGYRTFSELLEDAERKDLIRLKRDQRSGNYVVTGFGQQK